MKKTLQSKKTIVEFFPNKGMDDIKFGTSRNDVRNIMKTKYKANDLSLRGKGTDCYFDNSLQFSFEKNNTLMFIEVSSPPPIFLRLLGINAWEISGKELLKQIKEIDEINKDDWEWKDYPKFKNTHITFAALDKEHDFITNRTIPRWETIGIGDDRYWKQITKNKTEKPKPCAWNESHPLWKLFPKGAKITK